MNGFSFGFPKIVNITRRDVFVCIQEVLSIALMETVFTMKRVLR